MFMRKIGGVALAAALSLLTACRVMAPADGNADFLRVKGTDLVDGKGEKFFIRGTNLGNWLNPEGYMFGFGKCNSAHLIDEMFKQLVGPEETRRFWRAFKDNYITEADIAFIAATGANTVRLPFHYKLFTDEDYLDLTGPGDDFKRIDDVVGWCRRHGLRLILDMHDCPDGNTGDNIDDSHGHAWLFEEECYQRQYCDIWRRIAARYADEPVILGYDLMNEPISHRLTNVEELNKRLERVQFRALDAIREVDKNHIVILAGGQWNGNFDLFSDFAKDANMMYECHHYDFGNPVYNDARVQTFAAFRDKAGLPIFMGETGHNAHGWYKAITESMERNNIGWTYWPLKKPGDSSWLNFPWPEGWRETVVAFAEADRSSYAAIQANRPDRETARRLMREYVENCKAERCLAETGYLEAIGLKDPQCPIRVGTYNIRLSSGDIGTTNAWTHRCADLAAQIRALDLDAFGLQEVCPDQAAYLREQLPEFAFVGDHRGRDRVSDEASPVFYRKDRFTVEKSGTFWLSETPEVPASKSWGTACPRVCSYLVLTDRRNGKRFCFANTHTDHVSELAREKGMMLVLERMKEFGQGAPIIFTGDHNNTEVEKPARAVAAVLKNAMTESVTPPKGAWRTYNGWQWRAPEDEVSAVTALRETPEARNADDRARYQGSRIDYIWVSDGIRVKDYETVSAARPGLNHYPSDHFPVVATVVLP